ncbi:hypothetical protein NL676_032993 [Syzygium grande]|nr:hypothetical protein NL676_032993 [Syzygium grande]
MHGAKEILSRIINFQELLGHASLFIINLRSPSTVDSSHLNLREQSREPLPQHHQLRSHRKKCSVRPYFPANVIKVLDSPSPSSRRFPSSNATTPEASLL